MNLKERQEVYQAAIKKWGQRSQLEMAQEEATELALAIRKYVRKPDGETFLRVADEIADVQIMIEQIIMMHDNSQDVINRRKEFKMKRLKNRVFPIYEDEKEHHMNTSQFQDNV